MLKLYTFSNTDGTCFGVMTSIPSETKLDHNNKFAH